MIHSALILAPHQDDELNIAGLLLDQMAAARMEITVCFMTNGDYSGNEAVRLREAKSVAKGSGGYRIIYLGYGDGGYEGALLNSASDSEVTVSPAGHTETYGVGDVQDFHFARHGEHAKYTRENLLSDIKELLLFVRADLVFCVDEDNHPDHQLLSRTFDRAIAGVMKETDYRPLVLKKFAYLGTWYGASDYFVRPARATECASYGGYESRTDCKPHDWNDRIRFSVTPAVYGLRFWKSPLFRAYKKYKSQTGIAFFPRAVNADAVYWFYDTRGGAYVPSREFPVAETPFRFYDGKEDGAETAYKECRFFKLLYEAYRLLLYRVPNKLKRMVHHGF